MDDITERLRDFEGSDALGNGDFAVCQVAADEIERLRAALRTVAPLLDYLPHPHCVTATDAARAALREDGR